MRIQNKTKTCEQCGKTVEIDDESPHGVVPITTEMLPRIIFVECAGCGMKVSLETIMDQGIEKWHIILVTNKIFCAGCSHAFGLI